MERKATLKDVAAASGVSVAAVSLVLNNRPNRLAQETRDLILRQAELLHYVPNQNARSLVTRQSMLLALIVPDIENLFFASLAKAIEDVFAAEGYALIVANSDDSRDREHELLRMLDARGIDGLMLIAARESIERADDMRRDMQRMSCPILMVDRLPEECDYDFVGSDNHYGGALAARALVEAGHTAIGCIFADEESGSAQARKTGFMEELARHGISVPDALRAEGDYRFSGGYAAADQLIDAGATAVFCGNDLMALGFIERARERGVAVPQEMSVVGYDNIAARLGVMLPLTTFDQNVKALAADARDIMTATINAAAPGPKQSATRRLIKPSLVDRDTIREPRSQW